MTERNEIQKSTSADNIRCPWCCMPAARYDAFDQAVVCGACGASGPTRDDEESAIKAYLVWRPGLPVGEIDDFVMAARQVIGEIDNWNACVEKIIGRQPNYQWDGLETLRRLTVRFAGTKGGTT